MTVTVKTDTPTQLDRLPHFFTEALNAQKQDHLPDLFAEALNTRNLDLVDRFVSREVYINHSPWVEDGIDSMKTALGAYLEAFPDLQVSVDDVDVAEDLVVARLRYAGTQQGFYMGMEPTGKPIEMRSTDIWRVKDGYAVEHWDDVGGTEFLQSC